MKRRRWAVAVLVLAVLSGAGACKKFVTHPIYRQPVIHSVVVFPTMLDQGDSTMITIHATDPDGDALVYDWQASNGLVPKGAHGGSDYLYHSSNPSQVFYQLPFWPHTYDTAYVWCTVRDVRGGSASRRVEVYFLD